MERKEEREGLETSSTFQDKGQPLCADRPSESFTGGAASYPDDLVFNTDSLALGRTNDDGSKRNSPSTETALSANHSSLPETFKRVFKTAVFVCVSGLLAAFVVGAASFWFRGSYSVEAKVLFLGGDHRGKGVETWAVGDELRAITCTEVASSAAQDVFIAFPDAPGSEKEVRVQQATWAAANETGPATLAPTPEAQGLALWLRHELSVEPVWSNGASGFRLQMRGSDADLLKSALSAYIRRYLEYRTTVASTVSAELRSTPTEPETAPDTNDTCSPDSELRKLEHLTRSFELALQSMDTGKGTFKGFIPDVSIAATPSLARFQDKLLELEIKKRGLAVQFTQNSKEIRSIDQEIRGVKAAMRECLSEYVEFLKQGKKGLISQKAGQEQRKGSKAALEKQANRQCSGQLPNGDVWYRTRDGLYVFTSSPCVVSEPAFARVTQCTRTVLNWVSGRPVRPTVGTLAGSNTAGPARFASAHETLVGRDNCSPRLANSELSGKDEKQNQQEQIR